MYSEFANDPKVQRLSESDQRRFVMLLCIKCNGDVTVTDEDISFQLRISDEEWASTKATLVSKKLITKDNQPSAWEKRQQPSDSSAARVAKHREGKKHQCNGDVTVDVTNCNALEEIRREEEEKRLEEKRLEEIKDLSAPPAQTDSKNGTRLPADWQISKEWGEWALTEKPNWTADDVRRVAADFKDYWLANANKAKSKKADWLATWRIWVRSPLNEIKTAKVTQFATAAEQRAANTQKAVDEFLGDGSTVIEGELANA
jgi:hypothetical protein